MWRRTHRPFHDAYKRFVERHSLTEIGVERDFAASVRDRTTGRRVPV